MLDAERASVSTSGGVQSPAALVGVVFDERPPASQTTSLHPSATAFDAAAVTFMVCMCSMERRHRRCIIAFACGCALSSAYGFLAGTWPFGVVEAIWSIVALNRYQALRPILIVVR